MGTIHILTNVIFLQSDIYQLKLAMRNICFHMVKLVLLLFD